MRYFSLFGWAIYALSVFVPLNAALLVLFDINIGPTTGISAVLFHLGSWVVWGVMMVGMLSINLNNIVLQMGGMFEEEVSTYLPDAVAPLKDMVDDVAKRAGVTSVPKLAFIKNNDVNAFAASNWFGRSVICINRGSLDLPWNQLEALIAHEMAHIARGDSLVQSFIKSIVFQLVWGMMDSTVQSIASASRALLWIIAAGGAILISLAWLTELGLWQQLKAFGWLALSVLAVAGTARLLQFAIKTQTTFGHLALTRHMENRADYLAAKWTHPDDVIALLLTLKGIEDPNHAAHWSDNLYATHPSLEKRLARLKRMSKDL
ncbi:MAG: M48 family metallopeptidase [Porticoccaceae bacterium]